MPFGVSVNGYGVNDLVAASMPSRRRGRYARDGVRRHVRRRPELRSGGERHEVPALRRPHRAGIAAFPHDGGFGAFTTNFQDLGGLRQLPGLAVQRLMADGYGFGGEGDWKTSRTPAHPQDDVRGPAGGTSFMEDYTYHLGPGQPKILGAHMLEVCPCITAETPTLEIHPLGIGDREDPVRMRFVADPGELRGRHRRPGGAVPAHRQRDHVVSPTRRCRGCPSRAPSGSPSAADDIHRGVAARGRPHHTVLTTPSGSRNSPTSPPWRDGTAAHRRRHHDPGPERKSAGTRPTTG